MNTMVVLNNNIDIITNVTDDYLQEAVESMVGKVRSGILEVDNINLEEIFEKYREECESRFDLCHSDITGFKTHFTVDKNYSRSDVGKNSSWIHILTIKYQKNGKN
ncbi:hypothetical protein RhiirC2_109044 [Rhizophagus irregularis]|uniref:Uncharacterized protein n=1 Tax=Rhizophagus irregularis TaxID=588596 RepID=A0A2N1MRI7_9GLOM|nr:hypothetical protein RhiirC2_109044 [Rhizophagus irregularis]